VRRVFVGFIKMVSWLLGENIEGWEYWEGSSYRGDGSVSGIFKRVKEL
jgi:hypothetical protein